MTSDGPAKLFHLVLDTNVFLDIFSIHDLSGSVDKAGLPGDKTRFRLQRARESLLLAVALHRASRRTFSLHSEIVTKLTESVPPADGQLEQLFVWFWAHFVKEQCLLDWQPDSESLADPQPIGNAADDYLLDAAVRMEIPLITNEGNSLDGVVDKKLRARAKKKGVRVFTPAEYCRELGRDADTDATWFASRLEVLSIPDEDREAAAFAIECLRFVLCGRL